MKKITRNIICYLIIFCMLVPQLAMAEPLMSEYRLEAIVESITPEIAARLTLPELQEAVTLAETEEQATIIFNELIRYYNGEKTGVQTNAVAAASNTIDNYLSFTSSYNSSTNKLTVSYTIKGIMPSGVAFTLGYEYPASTRTTGASISLVGKAKGNYTQEFTPKGLVCAFRSCAGFSAHGYNESKAGTTFYPTVPRTTYDHVVTRLESKELSATLWAVNSAAVLFIQVTKMTLSISPLTAAIGGIVLSFFEDVVFDFDTYPARLSEGNRVLIEVWGTASSTSDKIYAKVTVWQYASESSPVLSSSTTIYHMPGF